MQVDEGRLSDFLFDAGLLPRRELERARSLASERGESMEETLVRTGMLRDDDVRRALAHVLGVPFIHLKRDSIDDGAMFLLPEAFSRLRGALAFAQRGGDVEVALLSLDDAPLVQQLLPGRRALPRLASRESMTHALIHYQKRLKEKFGELIAREVPLLRGVSHTSDAAVRAADALLRHALAQGAHEVHLNSRAEDARVSYRVGGGLYDAMVLPQHAHAPLSMRFKALANLPLVHDTPVAGKFKIALDGGGMVFVSVDAVPLQGGAEKVILSLARESAGKEGLSLSSLRFSERNKRELRRMLRAASGLVLVCGGEESGTTTLLYTLLDELNEPQRSLASVEDRIGMRLRSVAQMEARRGAGLSPSACLRAQLRHDPDVVMLDCELDEETALLAAGAANRGALVLLKVPAVGAARGVEHMLSLKVPPALLSAVLRGCVATALVPKLCAQRDIRHLSREEQTLLEGAADIKTVLQELKEERILDMKTPWKDVALYSAKECPQCTGGYAGVVALQEVMPASLVVKEAIVRGADARELAAAGETRSFMEDALYKAVAGLLSAEEMLEVAGM